MHKGYRPVVTHNLHVHSNVAAREEGALDHVLQQFLDYVLHVHQVVIYMRLERQSYYPFLLCMIS